MIFGKEDCGQKEQLAQGKNSWPVPGTKEVRLARTECEEEKKRVQRSDGVAGSGPVCDMGLEHLKELPFTVE